MHKTTAKTQVHIGEIKIAALTLSPLNRAGACQTQFGSKCFHSINNSGIYMDTAHHYLSTTNRQPFTRNYQAGRALLVEKAIHAEFFSSDPLLKYMMGTFFHVKIQVAIVLHGILVFTTFSPAWLGNEGKRERKLYFSRQKC